MTEYPELASLLRRSADSALADIVCPYLIEVWVRHYCTISENANIVETTQDNYSFLFDIAKARLIAAWTVSRGPNHVHRDRSRMRGHPQGYGSRYHRGHAIPHSLGGPTDINLVPQLGAINIGAFRPLEKEAVANCQQRFKIDTVFHQAAI